MMLGQVQHVYGREVTEEKQFTCQSHCLSVLSVCLCVMDMENKLDEPGMCYQKHFSSVIQTRWYFQDIEVMQAEDS